MKIDFWQGACCLELLFDIAVACILLDADGQKNQGDVLVDFQAMFLG